MPAYVIKLLCLQIAIENTFISILMFAENIYKKYPLVSHWLLSSICRLSSWVSSSLRLFVTSGVSVAGSVSFVSCSVSGCSFEFSSGLSLRSTTYHSLLFMVYHWYRTRLFIIAREISGSYTKSKFLIQPYKHIIFATEEKQVAK